MTKEQLSVVNKDLERAGLENIRNIILIENRATYGDVIKAMFPKYEETRACGQVRYGSKEYVNLEFIIDEDLWDSLYKAICEEEW